jgi:S1-C subfamily serine protease
MAAAVTTLVRSHPGNLAAVVLVAVAAALTAPVAAAQAADAEPGYLGVQLREETDRPEGGARVTEVVEGSPAADAGLRQGDIVVEFDGETIGSPVALTQRVHAKRPGDRATLTVIRAGQAETVEIELGKRAGRPVRRGDAPMSAEPPQPPRPVEPPEVVVPEQLFREMVPEPRDLSRYLEPLRLGDKPRLGVQLVETTPELRRHLGGSDEAGVLVSKILAGMPAEKAGLEVGDLILTVDGEPVAGSSELIRALRDKTGRTFPIEVVRGGRTRSVEVTIPEPEIDRPTGPRA